MAKRCAGTHSAVWATKEALVTPSVAARGFMEGSQLPWGWVLLFTPFGVVGEVCIFVRP
ncbi:MAG: hypothetical protein P8188_19410 [Gemmatimonadota bacterium]